MSVDSGVVDREDRSFFSGNVEHGSVGVLHVCDDDVLKDKDDDDLPDCPPGFENTLVGWGLGFRDSDTNCNVGDGAENRIGDVADSTKGRRNNTSVGNVSDCKSEILNKLNAAKMKWDGTRGKSGYVGSSLVWGKMRSHLWWPGQIFDTADLSKEALRHYKEGKFLVAYFGDMTFAWNDVTQLKSFQLEFERMASQSDLEQFCCAVDSALDEVFRRVVFGLSCTCLPENDYADIQSQIVENLGVYKKNRRRDAKDECSSVECFLPSKLVSYIKEAATLPEEFMNRLELVKCKAQLTSFCRWKGHRKLPEFADFGVLLDNNASSADLDGRDSNMTIVVNAHHMIPSKLAITEIGEHQQKRRGRPKGSLNAKPKLAITEGKGEHQQKLRGRPKGSLNAKPKLAITEDSGEDQQKRRGRPKGSLNAKPKFAITENKGEHQQKRRGRPKGSLNAKRKKKKMSDGMDNDDDELYVPYNYVKGKRKAKHNVRVEAASSENRICTSSRKSKRMKADRTVSAGDSGMTANLDRNVSDGLSPDVLFKQLALAAIDHDYSTPHDKFFSQFRNSSYLNHSISSDPENSFEEKSDEMIDKGIPERKYRTPHSEHVEDSSIDETVEESSANKFPMDSHDELPIIVAEQSTGVVSPILGSETLLQLQIFSDPETQDTTGGIPECKYRTPHSKHVEDSSTDGAQNESAANKCPVDIRDELPIIVAEHSTRVVLPILGSETLPQLQIFPDPKTQDTTGSHESAGIILDTPGNQVPDNHIDETMQKSTALLLRFSEPNHVPSVTDLNKIFSCYGPLHESETKIMKSAAKVIFKKKCDAEVAFRSTGKYSIFGPSLISYRLMYQKTKPKKSPSSRKRQKKAAPTEEGGQIPR